MTPTTVVYDVVLQRGDPVLLWDKKTGSLCVKAATTGRPDKVTDYRIIFLMMFRMARPVL